MPGGPRAEVAMMCGMQLLGVGGEGKLPAEKRGQAKMFGDVHRRRRGPWNANGSREPRAHHLHRLEEEDCGMDFGSLTSRELWSIH